MNIMMQFLMAVIWKMDQENVCRSNTVHDLTEKAMLGKLDPMIGRESEMERLMQILCRRTKNNPCLIGDPGELVKQRL